MTTQNHAPAEQSCFERTLRDMVDADPQFPNMGLFEQALMILRRQRAANVENNELGQALSFLLDVQRSLLGVRAAILDQAEAAHKRAVSDVHQARQAMAQAMGRLERWARGESDDILDEDELPLALGRFQDACRRLGTVIGQGKSIYKVLLGGPNTVSGTGFGSSIIDTTSTPGPSIADTTTEPTSRCLGGLSMGSPLGGARA